MGGVLQLMLTPAHVKGVRLQTGLCDFMIEVAIMPKVSPTQVSWPPCVCGSARN